MCGIIGYIGPRNAISVILNGLRRLEYRGYDSAGIAILGDNGIRVTRAVGKLSNLESRLQQGGDRPSFATRDAPRAIGIGHTRWATHGGVTEHNAHPHLNDAGTLAVIQNGIVENFIELKSELLAEGVRFRSETDTEVIPHLVDLYMKAGMPFARAAFAAIARLQGSNAVVMMSAQEPDKLIAARLGHAGGIVIGVNPDETFVASDIPGILDYTRNVIFLEDGEWAIAQAGQVRVYRLDGAPVNKQRLTIAWDPVSVEKGEYRHFMQKEIFEQARAVTDTLRGRVNFETGEVALEHLEVGTGHAEGIPARIHTVACGTSKHAGMIGKFFIERIAQVAVEVDYGSEYRYRDPIIEPGIAVLGITQSGETADTLAAMSLGKARGARIWAIVNAIGSQAERMAEGVIHMRAGPEIGVCSTKTFLTSIVDQYLLACALAQRVRRSDADGRPDPYALAKDLALLPGLISQTLKPDPIYEALAHRFHDRRHFLFLGRGINYPIALEGALKLKEISYIHAEGYPAGEMKHGPIALIDETMPVVCVAVQDGVYEKMISQIEQVKARGGIVIAIATEGDDFIRQKADYVINVPAAPALLTPALTAIPMQRLAYEIATHLGCDVDQPRNLAKSVTVE
ncbi:MAG: glutamine--fructose-6-phosphate transaminase (isomerizing) [Chloroflexi bacterium]|jgi:glucosamine--fructose-6-phosphate aminotransferase (isomerizing)|uniref:glutamine--fructose-6-phosphate transaminase (isomerizing) n=1 Tax=Candidatus Roseilinea sp. NK_OTU-006 TaxID=2704250 RepID=UPI000F0D323D|nr:glutamine--fructose-6-phosphate transaminase (isomerizing) [Candidatus Roseilinea sp. NK_OTU-006]RMG64508.1 MAG: glutamine--fructose-6-phosphate transaminase (isomerizing) [Chloroflexota bacterium]